MKRVNFFKFLILGLSLSTVSIAQDYNNVALEEPIYPKEINSDRLTIKTQILDTLRQQENWGSPTLLQDPDYQEAIELYKTYETEAKWAGFITSKIQCMKGYLD